MNEKFSGATITMPETLVLANAGRGLQPRPKRLKTSAIDFQINNFDANGYHPFKGCYPCELNLHVMEV